VTHDRVLSVLRGCSAMRSATGGHAGGRPRDILAAFDGMAKIAPNLIARTEIALAAGKGQRGRLEDAGVEFVVISERG